MTVKSRNAWNDILRACADMKELAEQIFEYANEWAENDTSVDDEDEDETRDEDDVEEEMEIPYNEAIHKTVAEFAKNLRKELGGRKVTVKVYVKGAHE